MTSDDDLMRIVKTAGLDTPKWRRAVRIIARRILRDPDSSEGDRRMASICRTYLDRGFYTNEDRAEIDDFLHGPRF